MKHYFLFFSFSLLVSLSILITPLITAGNEGSTPGAQMIELKTDRPVSPSPKTGLRLAVITCTDATIIPTAGSIEWYKEDIPRIIQKELHISYSEPQYFLIPLEEIEAALNKNGYDAQELEMPDKEDVIKIAADLNTEAILVMELSDLGVTVTRTSYKYYAIARYRAYQINSKRFILRRFVYEGAVFSNKASQKEQKDQLIATITATIDTILANCRFGVNWQ